MHTTFCGVNLDLMEEHGEWISLVSQLDPTQLISLLNAAGDVAARRGDFHGAGVKLSEHILDQDPLGSEG